MKGCSYPECEEEESLPFKCKLCDQYYCSKHRLPEQHDCLKIGVYQTEEYRKAKVGTPVQKTEEPKKEKKKSRRKKSLFSPSEVEQSTMYVEPQDRFIARSSFFTFYDFKKNFFNILSVIFIVTVIFVLSDLVEIKLYDRQSLGLPFLWVFVTNLFASIVVFGGHMVIQQIVASRNNTKISNILWIQGIIIALIGIFIPFILIPTFLVFRSYGDNDKSRGITALSGILWILIWQAIIITTLSFNYLPPPLTAGLQNIPMSMLFYLSFMMIPFGIFHGKYISSWNRRAVWIIYIAIILLFVLYFIVSSSL
jgi:hypothetical protein